MVYFDQICIHMHVNIILPLASVTAFLRNEALLSISLAGPWSVSENACHEQHGIFGSKFAYLFILTLSSHWYTKH